MQMIQSVHNEQSDKKKPVQTKVHMSKHDDMWLRARFFPLRKAVPSPRTHLKYPWVRGSTVLAHGFSARDRKTRQNVGGRTDGDRTGHQAASKQNRRTTTLCTVFNICLVVEFPNMD